MEETTLKQEVQMLRETLETGTKKKKKKNKSFNIPFKGRVGKSRMKKGYATVLVIEENNNVDFKKERIEGSTIKLEDTYHAVEGEDVLYYKGKPLIIQAKKRKNPYNPNRLTNETYGQKHIMARMLNETISFKKKIGGLGISIGLVVIAGIIIYALMTG